MKDDVKKNITFKYSFFNLFYQQKRLFLPPNLIADKNNIEQNQENKKNKYWLILYRKSNREELFYGIPGDKKNSSLVKTFLVKTGIPKERPTPLPKLVGRKYWLIIDKFDSRDNQETAPYFLVLDIPAPSVFPFGPVPYDECNGQCNWVTPGYFGLHGINGDPNRLSSSDPGSSGCIRHKDEDIIFLYQLLDPKKEPIRYYVIDQ